MPIAPINNQPTKIESLSTLYSPVPSPDWQRVYMSSLKHPNTNFWVVAKTNEIGMEAGWQVPFSDFLKAQFKRNGNGVRSNFHVVGYVSLFGPKAELDVWTELANVNGNSGTFVSGVLFDNFGSFPVARRKDLYEKLKILYGPTYTIFGTFRSPYITNEFAEKPYCDVMILQKGKRFEKDGVVALQNTSLPLSKL